MEGLEMKKREVRRINGVDQSSEARYNPSKMMARFRRTGNIEDEPAVFTDVDELMETLECLNFVALRKSSLNICFDKLSAADKRKFNHNSHRFLEAAQHFTIKDKIRYGLLPDDYPIPVEEQTEAEKSHFAKKEADKKKAEEEKANAPYKKIAEAIKESQQ